MYLDELAIGVIATLLVKGRLRRSRAHYRVRGFAEDRANTTGGDNDRVGRKDANFHGAQIHGADAPADAVAVNHCGEEFAMLVLGDFAFRFVSAHLLIERIQELLPGGSAGKCGAIVEGSAETPEVQQPFGRAVVSNAHADEQ